MIIDILGGDALAERTCSLAAVRRALNDGQLIFSAVVWAELCGPFITETVLVRAFAWLRPQRKDFPFLAAYAAGVAHRLYASRGGLRERTLPDFLIGAHALANGHRLLTRYPERYFLDLAIIAPDTHPVSALS